MHNRNSWVDYAKAIGIILVVFGHVERGLISAGMVTDPASLAALMLADSVIYSFHMPLFFFLSGLFFIESLARRGRIGLLANKLDTLIYPYILWSLLQGGCEFVLSRYTNGHVSMHEVLALLWQPRAQFWFLYALFLVFVVCAQMYVRVKSRFIFLVLFAVLFAVLFVFKRALTFSLIGDYITGNAVFFAFGICFARVEAGMSSRHAGVAGDHPGQIRMAAPMLLPMLLTMLIAVLAFMVAQTAFYHIFGLVSGASGFPVLMLSLLSIVCVAVVSMWLAGLASHWSLQAFRAIGRSSMAIYLMHILAGSGARVILNKVVGSSAVSLHLVVGTLAGVVLPLMGLWLIRRANLGWLLAPPEAMSVSLSVGRRYPANPG